MSLTANSSKHKTHASSASAFATGGSGSFSFVSPRVSNSRWRWMRSWASAMKSLKMHPSLSADGDQLEEHVHEHGSFAAPDPHHGRLEPPDRLACPRGACRTASRAHSTWKPAVFGPDLRDQTGRACQPRGSAAESGSIAPLPPDSRSADERTGIPTHRQGKPKKPSRFCPQLVPGHLASANQRNRLAARGLPLKPAFPLPHSPS